MSTEPSFPERLPIELSAIDVSMLLYAMAWAQDQKDLDDPDDKEWPKLNKRLDALKSAFGSLSTMRRHISEANRV